MRNHRNQIHSLTRKCECLLGKRKKTKTKHIGTIWFHKGNQKASFEFLIIWAVFLSLVNMKTTKSVYKRKNYCICVQDPKKIIK